jgi:hypothetical protein
MSTPPVTNTPAPSTQSAASTASQQAALNRLLAKYKAAKTQGDLTSLGRQIQAAAKALGQQVTLPKVTLSSNTGSSPTPAPKASTDLEA